MSRSSSPSHLSSTLPAGACKVDALSSFGGHPIPVPVALEAVHAGFPSVAQDYFNGDFSFDQNVIIHPSSTYIIHVAGESMTGAGIFDGDLLVVDRSLEPRQDDIVIAILDDEMLVKRLVRQDGHTILHAENPSYPDFIPQDGECLVIWGVVTGNYHWQRIDSAGGFDTHPLPQVTYPGRQESPVGQEGRTTSGQQGTIKRRTSHFQPAYPTAEWGHHA